MWAGGGLVRAEERAIFFQGARSIIPGHGACLALISTVRFTAAQLVNFSSGACDASLEKHVLALVLSFRFRVRTVSAVQRGRVL